MNLHNYFDISYVKGYFAISFNFAHQQKINSDWLLIHAYINYEGGGAKKSFVFTVPFLIEKVFLA